MGNQENEMLQPSFCAGGKKKRDLHAVVSVIHQDLL